MGDGEGWRREVDWGVLVAEEVMIMSGFFWGGWAERVEEEGRGWRVVVADMVGGGFFWVGMKGMGWEGGGERGAR